jgi:hypothetical protein
MSLIPAKADQFGDFTYTATATDVTISGYTGTGGAVTIPSAIVGLPVTSIGSQAFQLKTSLTSVTIPNSVTSIGDFAFYNCTSLTSLTVDAANPNYSSMAGVLFNKNQTSLIQYPQGKTGSYTIPNSVTIIGSRAFRVCTGLTSLTIPNSVTNIGSNAFDGCTGLNSVTIPNSVTSIADSAFYGCTGLNSVTIGSGVTSIGSGVFQSCTRLTSVTIPNSVTSIADSAFYGCTGLNSVTIGSGVTNIGSQAFDGCTGLISVTIPNSVTSIGSQSFYGCTGLTSVTIGSGATSIGTSAFLTCPNLLSIYIKGNAPALGTTVFTSNSKSNVYYRSGTTGWTSTYGGLSTVALVLPTITGQPSSVIANPGENAAFSVIAKTTFPLTLSYQWQRNGLAIPSATAESLYLNSIQSANVGTYTVIVSNDIGSVSSAVTLTLTQGALYTQSQYDSALQVGLNAGMAVGMATGRTQVTDSPNNYGLYNLSQVQALHVGTPLLAKDSATGKFKLTVGVEKSTNLVNFSPMAIPVGAATINAQGKMEFQFTSQDNAAFFRIESR